MTLKQNRREGDEKISAIHSVVPGDVISVTEKGGGGERSQGVSMRDKHGETLKKGERKETDGIVQKSRGFEMPSTYFKSTGIKS